VIEGELEQGFLFASSGFFQSGIRLFGFTHQVPPSAKGKNMSPPLYMALFWKDPSVFCPTDE
jgi:hypothetical protein